MSKEKMKKFRPWMSPFGFLACLIGELVQETKSVTINNSIKIWII